VKTSSRTCRPCCGTSDVTNTKSSNWCYACAAMLVVMVVAGGAGGGVISQSVSQSGARTAASDLLHVSGEDGGLVLQEVVDTHQVPIGETSIRCNASRDHGLAMTMWPWEVGDHNK
jgi:hypothetical protein